MKLLLPKSDFCLKELFENEIIWTSGRITTVSIGSGTEPDMNFRMCLNYTPLSYEKKSPGTATWRTGYDFSMRKVRQI